MLRTNTLATSSRIASRLQPTLHSNIQPFNISKIPHRTATRRAFTTSKSKPTTNFTFTSHGRPSPTSNTATLLQRLRSLRFFHNNRRRLDGKVESIPKAEPVEAEPISLGAKMRKLSREYGWSAVGVYFFLGAIDFPFSYLLVKTVGTDRIGQWEEVVVSNVKRVIPESVKTYYHDWRTSMKKAELEMTGDEKISGGVEMAGWGVEEAEAANKKDASLATQLALAYAIHKSFIFIRVPITVAITPRIVKMLRGWGWDIGKRTTKEAKALKRATFPPKKPRRKLIGRRSEKGL